MTEIVGIGLIILAVVGAVTTPWVLLSRAKDEREAARVRASSLNSELIVVRERLDRITNDLKSEEARSDDLYDELAKSSDHPDPVGARDRVLQAWKLKHDVARGRTVSMPAPSAADKPGPDGLIDPFAAG